jgi:APA family basic amino acid/polyamine antiporter
MTASHDPARGPALHGDAALIRAVGTFALAAAVVNVIIGGGIFKMPAALSGQVGIAAPLALVAGALAIVPVALCFAAIGSRVRATGGPYTYLTAVFGSFAGFIAGALMWISNLASSAGVAAAFAEQMANLLPVFADRGARAGLLVGLYVVLFALNAFGVKLGARAIAALAALKLAPLCLLVLAGIWFVDWSQVSFAPGDVPSLAALGSGMVLVMFAYSGMETALVPSGELRDPARNVPRATIAAILLVVLLYLGLQIVGQGLLGPALAGSKVPIADTGAALWGPARTLLLITACVSMAGFLLGNLLGTSRLVFALGRDGYLPAAYGRVDARHRVPLLALLTHAGIALALALGGDFESLALISGGAICLMYALVSVAAWRAQRLDLRDADIGAAPLVLRGGALVPLISFVAMVAIVITLKPEEWSAIGIALAALVAVYVALRLWRGARAG